MIEIFNEEGVAFVVIGGFAGIVHGSSLMTRDLDVVPDRQIDNLERLARALTRMNANIRTASDPVPVRLDGAFLAAQPLMLNLVTDFGELDLTFVPAGPAEGYAGWRKNAVEMHVDEDVVALIGSLDDIIASKRAADRPKDHLGLVYLEELRDQIDEVGRHSGSE